MKKIVFYSWQSDLKNSTNRTFIQDALEQVASIIASDHSIGIEPVIDRDTQGVAGAPDIAATIFAKITSADVFVADISIISESKNGRPTPNPNVLIELGFAIKALGHEHVILVFNKSFGDVRDLPFDLRTRRLLIYEFSGSTDDNKAELKKALVSDFEKAMKTAIQSDTNEDEASSLLSLNAIEEQKNNRIICIRRDLERIFKEIIKIKPKIHLEGGTAVDLIESLEKSQEFVAQISKLLSMAATVSDKEALLEIYKWLGTIYELYNLPRGFSGTFGKGDFDFFKFIGHELFVTLVANLIKEDKWELLQEILEEQIPMKHLSYEGGHGLVNWSYAYSYVFLLDLESKSKGRISLHADILKTRHTDGGLSAIMPFQDFMEADFFLYLLFILSHNQENRWYPPSIIYLDSIPLFIKKATKITFAKKMLIVFEITEIKEWKSKFIESIPAIQKLFPFGSFGLRITSQDIEKIGSN